MDSPQATYQELSIRFMTSMDKKKGFSQHSSNDDLLASFDDTICCFLRCDLGLAVCKQDSSASAPQINIASELILTTFKLVKLQRNTNKQTIYPHFPEW